MNQSNGRILHTWIPVILQVKNFLPYSKRNKLRVLSEDVEVLAYHDLVLILFFIFVESELLIFLIALKHVLLSEILSTIIDLVALVILKVGEISYI